jgi:hypothetical protein
MYLCMMSLMRTTLTLDPDVAERLRQETQGGRLSLKKVVNERLRIGLGLQAQPARQPYVVEPNHSGFQSGVDPRRLNQLNDELEAETAIEKISTSRK